MKASTRWRVVSGVAICGAVIGVLMIDRPPPPSAQARGERPRLAVAPSPAPPIERRSAPSAAESPPDSEQASFARAEALLMTEPSRTMDLLRAADAQFPRGALADERQFLKLRARVNLDQIAEARVDATEYLELNPKSPIAGRIHQLLGIRPPFELPPR